MDKLEEIILMQKKLADFINSPGYPKNQQERISVLSVAVIHEAVELQRLTNWKWWKKPHEFNEKLAREELIDILHFVIQIALELNMDADDLIKEYKSKNEINKNRQKNNY